MADFEGNQITAENIVSFVIGPDFHLAFNASGAFVLFVAVFAVVVFLAALFLRKGMFGQIKSFEIDKVQIGVGNGSITLHPNETDRQIAYAIWVELSTRKIGLPIDIEHDVIEEIYNSWYILFGVVRELVKGIPASKLRREDTQKIVELSFDVLNEGLRPHLTMWQARSSLVSSGMQKGY